MSMSSKQVLNAPHDATWLIKLIGDILRAAIVAFLTRRAVYMDRQPAKRHHQCMKFHLYICRYVFQTMACLVSEKGMQRIDSLGSHHLARMHRNFRPHMPGQRMYEKSCPPDSEAPLAEKRESGPLLHQLFHNAFLDYNVSTVQSLLLTAEL